MKRAVTALGLTAAGLVLVLNFHTRGAFSVAAAPVTVQPSPAPTSPSDPAPSASPSAEGSTGTSSGASTASRTVVGPAVQTRWGPVQVQIVVSGKTITDVQTLQVPNNNSRDYEINSYAVPVYRQEALQAQSAQIDVISGATVTWTGYTQSLQAAIDQAGLQG